MGGGGPRNLKLLNHAWMDMSSVAHFVDLEVLSKFMQKH